MTNKNTQKIEITEARKKVSELIFKVLTQSFCVREAIKLFPADVFDPSVQCVWHALIHYEADEDYRLKDPEYAKEQDDYLELIAFTMQNGQALPQNIIESYKKYYKHASIPRSQGIISLLKSLLRFTI